MMTIFLSFQKSRTQKITGYSRHTLRFYEASGLIRPPQRTDSNYRIYDQKTVQELLFVRECQRMGFQLQEIDGLLKMRRASSLDCAQGAVLLEQKIQEVSGRIKQLQQLHRLLRKEQQQLLHSAQIHGLEIPTVLQGKLK